MHAWLTAARTALPALDPSRLRRQAEGGDSISLRLLHLEPRRFCAAARLGGALTLLFGAAFAADGLAEPLRRWLSGQIHPPPAAAPALHLLSVGLVTLAFSWIALLLGSLIPAHLAAQNPERAARLTCGAASALTAVLHPFSHLMSASAGGIVRLLRQEPPAWQSGLSCPPAPSRSKSPEKGMQATEKEMIENISAFNNMTAEDVMIHRTGMMMIQIGSASQDIVQTIEQTGRSRYPVYGEDADDIIGILNSRDYFLNARLPHPKPLRALLREAYFIPESVRAGVLFRDMQARKIQMAIVVDEYGGTSGLVTMEDLLEEIVGKIYDEFDPQDRPEIIPAGENLWRAAGCADLKELAAALNICFPEDEESETLGGLIFAQLSVIPEDGSHPEVSVYGLHIRVDELSDRRVEWASISKLP